MSELENKENNAENKVSDNIPEAKVENANPKNHTGFLIVVLVILTIFISSTFGAFFGFMAGRVGTGFFSNLKGGMISSLFSKNNAAKSPSVTKQNVIQEDSAVIDVVKNSTPAVVSIVISKDVSQLQNSGGMPNFMGDPFNFFFGPDQGNGSGGNSGGNNGGGNSGGNNSGGSTKQTIGGGTGFFITSDGMIVTNRHVVDDTTADYTVVTNDGKQYTAKVLARDPVNDIAVIKIDGTNFPTLSLGDSDSSQIGETVIAIGNSLGEFSNTVSRGIISGLQRNVTAGGDVTSSERLSNIIQTDAAINPGNSGGPLININGEVIGINVAIAQGAQNIGFAIPINQVKKVVDQVKTTGKISTPYIGVRYIPVDATIQSDNNLPYDYGDLVARGQNVTDFAVVPGSPADKAGIVENDIILEADGKKLEQANGPSLSDVIATHNVGDVITLKIWHKGNVNDVQVTLAERQ